MNSQYKNLVKKNIKNYSQKKGICKERENIEYVINSAAVIQTYNVDLLPR